MNIAGQITNLANPQEFTHLCHVLFADIYKDDFEQIDDDQSDRGNDSYVRSKGIFFARHCFKRAQKGKQINQILKKVKTDLQKAQKLHESGEYSIKKWFFVSSYPMPERARVEINKLSKDYPFDIGCLGPAYLASQLLKRDHLLKEFAFLQINKVDENLNFIRSALTDRLLGTKEVTRMVNLSAKANIAATPVDAIKTQLQSSKASSAKRPGAKSRDYTKIMMLSKGKASVEKDKQIKAIIYGSSDLEASLQGVLALVASYKFSRSTANDILNAIDIGIDTARSLNIRNAESVLLAEKGSILSTQFCLLDLEGWGKVEMTNVSGFPIVTEEERQKIITRLKLLNRGFNVVFKEAMEKSLESNDYLAVTRVFSRIGSSAGQRAGHFESLNIRDRAALEERMAKSAFIYAKSVCIRAGDEEELAYILHNFANMLGYIGEKEEALGVLSRSLKIARKFKMADILSMSEKTKRLIKEPKIKLS